MSVTTIAGHPGPTTPPAEEAEAAASLAARVGRGDAAAEAELVRRYERATLAILQHQTGDRELARDLCQETFMIVLRRLREAPLADPGRLAGFIAQTARNLSIGEKRKHVRRRTDTTSAGVEQVADETASGEEKEGADSAASAVRKLLMELRSERDRTAIVRFYLEEEDKDRICSDLGLTDLQFNQILFRARERMRTLFGQRGIGRHDLLGLAFL